SVAQGSTETENLQVITIGEASRAQVRLLHWENGRPEDISNDQVRYSYDNLIGSSALEVDGDGKVISMEEYYPYGGTAILTARNQAEVNYKTVRYSGKERDATGLYYYGYRYYQPWVGRWLSSDPAGTIDGLNLYRMVRNNPVTLKDDDGKQPSKPNGFTWVGDGKGGHHPFAGMSLFSENDNIDGKASYLKKKGINTVISLEAEDYERSKKALNNHGITHIVFPIDDWHTPSQKQLEVYNELVDKHSKFGGVATHCWGGMGRTGVFLASRLIHIGKEQNAQDALLATRKYYNQHSVEMKAQYNTLARFSDSKGLNPSKKADTLGVHWDSSHGDDGMNADPDHGSEFKAGSGWSENSAISFNGISQVKPEYSIFAPQIPLNTTGDDAQRIRKGTTGCLPFNIFKKKGKTKK
ncbi:RHS repeat protein, partial [Aliivibrio fischeri]